MIITLIQTMCLSFTKYIFFIMQYVAFSLVFSILGYHIYYSTACTKASTTAPANPQEKKATKPLGHDLDPSKTRKMMLQQPPGRPNTH